MHTLDALFDAIEAKVSDRQEQDKWEEVASEQFPALVNELFMRIETVLQPIQARLANYSPASVQAMWQIARQQEVLEIHFDTRTLRFRPVGVEAPHAGDRYTVQILRGDENLVKRLVPVYHHPTASLKLSIITHTSTPEPLDDHHLIQLLIDELLGS